jgi:hypothetical protein
VSGTRMTVTTARMTTMIGGGETCVEYKSISHYPPPLIAGTLLP